MRRIISVVICFLICGVFSSQLMAQAPPPPFLFLLEGKGVPTGTVHAFSMNSATGGIAEVPGSPFNAGLIPNQLIVDPTGRFVYVTNQESEDITAFAIDPAAGALTQLPGSPFLIGAQPIAAAVDPTGRFFYVFATSNVNGADQEVLYEYTIDSITGVLTLTSSSPTTWEYWPGTLISTITFDAAGNYAYLGQIQSGMFGAPILICSVDFGSGNLSVAGSVQPASNGEENQVAVSPTGSFLYSSNSTGNVINAFSSGAIGGQLTEIPGSPYTMPNGPSSLVVHPSGNFLYVANENQIYQTSEQPSQYTGSISGYSINSVDGSLMQVSGSPFAAGTNPVSMVLDPTGRFAYSASSLYTGGYASFAQIMGFSVDAVSGALTPFSSAAFSDSVNSNGAQLSISNGLQPTNPVPMISSLNPPASIATDVAFTLQVNGANFVPGAAVYFGGQFRSTTFVNSTQLNASILASDVDNNGNIIVFVFNPLPGGGASTSVEFPVSALVPTISTTNPTSVIANPNVFDFYCVGTNYTTSSVIYFNGAPQYTLYFGPNLLFGFAPAGDVSAPGIATISIITPSNGVPGGGTSNPVIVSILPPFIQLSVSNISPVSTTAGGPGLILTVTGNGFAQGSQVTFNLLNVPTTLISSTELLASIPASAIAVAGNPYVIVNNPGGVTSTPLTFTINNPPPGTGSIIPQSLPAGSNAFTLNVTGTNFTPNSIVLVNGVARSTTYMSSSLLLATLLPSDLKHSAMLNITVSNPPPGGGTTAALALSVADYNVSAVSPVRTLHADSQANFTLMVSAENGTLSHAITFTASGLPPGVTASFSPASVPAGSGSVNVTLSLTPATHSSTEYQRIDLLGRLTWLFFSGMFFVLSAVWMWFAEHREGIPFSTPLFLVIFLIGILLSLTACGSMVTSPPVQNNTGTPAGTYMIIVGASSGNTTIDTQITLTIM
ncbi:MAG TPA: beta-propeller fold lactonase family protein [Candidatus Saccharimonadales bacterium]|nr:beta-propeller fold lactonase family protein [Candidatus Saccharimonadales bacterium]